MSSISKISMPDDNNDLTKINFFESLPDNLIIEFCSYLDILDLVNLQRTNQRNKNLIDTDVLWSKINDQIGFDLKPNDKTRKRVIQEIEKLHEIIPIDYPHYNITQKDIDDGFKSMIAQYNEGKCWFNKLYYEISGQIQHPNNPSKTKITIESSQDLLKNKITDTMIIWKTLKKEYNNLEYPNFEKLILDENKIITAFEKWIEANKNNINQDLNLSNKNIHYLLESLGRLNNLKNLDISQNPLTQVHRL